MMTFNARKLVPTIAGFRDDVLANRAACKTAFATALHDTLAAKLNKAVAALHEETETEMRLAAGKGTEDGDFLYEMTTMTMTLENHIEELRREANHCDPAERAQIEAELEQARAELAARIAAEDAQPPH